MSVINEAHMGCDRCGRYVADGDGHYVNDDRVCAECNEREPVEVVQLRATLAVINEIMGIQPKKESK